MFTETHMRNKVSQIFENDDSLKELIIKQDEDLANILPDFVHGKISKSLQGKNDINEINFQKIFEIDAQELELSLKNKLQSIQDKNPDMDLQQAYEKLIAHELSWINRLINLISRLFFLKLQEPMIDSIAAKLQDKFMVFLNEEIEKEKRQILKEINEFTAVNDAGHIGEAVHEVKKYRDAAGKLFFIKDVLHGIKGRIYKLFTGIDNEGIREVIGSVFYQQIGMEAAKVGLITKETQATKIFSKQIGNIDDKICSLGQLLKGWNFETGKADESKKIEDPKAWLNQLENAELKANLIKAHALSFLIGNRDLKDDNIMIARSPGGTLRAIPIDFSLSCNNMNNLSYVKPFIHFNTREMRHRDSLKLFDQDEYKEALRNAVDELKKNEITILKEIRLVCEVMYKIGFQSNQYEALMRNIRANVTVAEKACGLGEGIAI